MRIAVLGTGGVGQTIAGKLAELDHDVTMGTRDVDASLARTEAGFGAVPLAEWCAEHPAVTLDTLAKAAASSELVFNCTAGAASLDALRAAGADNLADKILVDVANPLDFSAGPPPTLSVCNTDSLGERIQREFPRTKVVKTLNTVTAPLMVAPGAVNGADHQIFVSGEDAGAKAEVTRYLQEWFGWRDVLDLGGIRTARGVEMWLPLWLELADALGTLMLNIKLVR